MKSRCAWVVIVAATALLALSGCASVFVPPALVVSGPPKLAASDAPPSGPLVAAVNDFGLALLSAAAVGGGQDPGRNVVVSPVSVHAALSLTANGATGETLRQIREVLRLDAIDPGAANRQWASLLGQLDGRSREQVLSIANAMWGDERLTFKQPFIAADRDFFGAELSILDLQALGSLDIMNAWASRNTHGQIGQMVSKVSEDALLYIANAAYFQGDWIQPFEHMNTATGSFTRPEGTAIDVDMMHASRVMPYVENSMLQATRLFYQGGDTAFYIVLPRPGVAFESIVASLEGQGFEALRRDLSSQSGQERLLGLPRLATSFDADLAGALKAMGMPRAFDSDQAEFGDMADTHQPISIGSVGHQTKVTVDEAGTVAAAVTVVEMRYSGSTIPPRFIIDRPFLFALVDEKSGVLLFLGEINDPTMP